MKKRLFLALHVLGWAMLLLVLLMGAVFSVAADDKLYFRLQMEADILPSAGISSHDLRVLDQRLSAGLFAPLNADAAFDNQEIEVFGSLQPPFGERELAHLYDCRRLLSPTQPGMLYAALLLAGAILLCCGGRSFQRGRLIAAWTAAGLLLAPLAALGAWAAVDFSAAFDFFHRMLFSNDLWLLNPQTDLLIRICPASMFAGMGLRIALRALGALLGGLLLYTLLYKLDRRKKTGSTKEGTI